MSRQNSLGYYYSPASSDATELSALRTSERLAITTPRTGTAVYDTDLTAISFYDGDMWREIAVYPPELMSVTAAEFTQLSKIDNVVIDNVNWQRVGALDQTVGTTSAPTFVGINLEETGPGTDTILINAPAVVAAPYTLTLPVDDGTPGDMLVTDGAGVLTWSKSLSFDNIAIPRGPAKPINLKGYKIYEHTFTLDGGFVDDGNGNDVGVDPMVYIHFTDSTPWGARFRLITTDWDDETNVAFLSGELAGGRGSGALVPTQPIVIGNTSTIGSPTAWFSTEVLTTSTTILLKKDSNKASGNGPYQCTVYIEIFNGTVEKLVDGNTTATIVTFEY